MIVIDGKVHLLAHFIFMLNDLCLLCFSYYQVNIEGRPLNCETGAKNLFYGYDGELCGVEQLALQYYADEGGGWQGTHSEGGIWMTIFGLLMWDIMFSDIQDVFQSKFQVYDL